MRVGVLPSLLAQKPSASPGVRHNVHCTELIEPK